MVTESCDYGLCDESCDYGLCENAQGYSGTQMVT